MGIGREEGRFLVLKESSGHQRRPTCTQAVAAQPTGKRDAQLRGRPAEAQAQGRKCRPGRACEARHAARGAGVELSTGGGQTMASLSNAPPLSTRSHEIP